MRKGGLYFKVAEFIGLVHFYYYITTAKMKLAILAFLYCGEFVKNPPMKLVGDRLTHELPCAVNGSITFI